MERSDAQKRADKKYSQRLVSYTFKFNPNTDADIIENLNKYKENGGSVRGLIIQLLRDYFSNN